MPAIFPIGNFFLVPGSNRDALKFGQSMTNWIKSIFAMTALASATVIAQVEDYSDAKAKIEQAIPLKVAAIGDAPVPGLLQIETDRGIFYTSKDGKYFLQARIFNLDEGMRNETDMALADIRLEGVEQFKDSVIEFKAKNERYVVNVFTDITCGYCRKLHNEISQYNDLGITVRYLAFPRGGLRSASFNDMVSVWCADDKQGAMTAAKSGESVAKSSCANKVEAQYNFGLRTGVSGTPNIILPDGTLIGGYQPADQLIKSLRTI